MSTLDFSKHIGEKGVEQTFRYMVGEDNKAATLLH